VNFINFIINQESFIGQGIAHNFLGAYTLLVRLTFYFESSGKYMNGLKISKHSAVIFGSFNYNWSMC